MTIDDKNIPICDCHKVKMFWKTDNRKKRKGYWSCSVKNKAALARYRHSEKGLKMIKRDNSSVKGYVRKRKYQLKRLRVRIINQLEELQNVE